MPIKLNTDGTLPQTPFDPGMFMEDGFLYEEPLNHFIRIQPFNKKYTLLVNAGYLANNFLESERQGYEALKEVIIRAKKENTANPPTDTTGVAKKVQSESPSDEAGSVCGTGGDNSPGE